jgi:hypothetical protein
MYVRPGAQLQYNKGTIIMLEKDVARSFTTIFNEYQIWTPSNRIAGWPDKGVQLNGSVIVWFELKLITLRIKSQFKVSSLEPEQAAWLAKWQKAGGFCYLFLGIIDNNGNLMFGVFGQEQWANWLKVPKTVYHIDELELYVSTGEQVKKWFNNEYVMFR